MNITSYDEQYKKAREYMIEAMKNNQNIVLWGDGCNGKTHLINELRISEPELYNNYYRVFQLLGVDSHKKFILECCDINVMLNEFKNYSFVFINMNQFKYKI